MTNAIGMIDAGYAHGLALSEGRIFAWGDNSSGQTNSPAETNVVWISAGSRHNLAVTMEGSVLGWGDNSYGQSVPPVTLSNVLAVSAGGFHSLALMRNGMIAPWGQGVFGQTNVPAGATNVSAIAAGGYHSLALRQDGKVLAWGYNANGQLTVPSDLTNVSGISTKYFHNLAIRSNRTVAAWGWNAFGQTTVPPLLTNVVGVAAGYSHSVALRTDGRLVSWGDNSAGQCVGPDEAANVSAVAAGANFTLLRARGPVVTLHPVGTPVQPGSNLVLTAAAAADTPLDYQWEKDGQDLPGATGESLSLNNLELNQAGYYRARITGPAGTVYTRSALLSRGPQIIEQPSSVAVFYGSNATLSVKAVGVPEPMYYWRFKNVLMGGYSGPSLLLTNLTYSGNGSYTVTVSNYLGSVTSQVAVVSVQPRPNPAVSAYASNTPQDALFRMTGTESVGTGYSYQWRFQGVDIPGATNYSLEISRARSSHAGCYSYRYTTPAGSLISSELCISVDKANPVRLANRPLVLDAGDNFGIPVAAQWQRNGMDIPGATNLLHEIEAVQRSDAGDYAVRLTDGAGDRLIQVARVTVLPDPARGTPISWGSYAPAVPAWGDAISVGSGTRHGLLLSADGTVAGFGDNGCWGTNIPPALTNAVAVAAGEYNSMALRNDGRVFFFGNCSCTTCASPIVERAIGISMGSSHGIALLNDGTVSVVAGPAGPADLTNAVAVAAGYEHSAALRADGKVVAWGGNGYGQATVPPTLSSVKGIAAGAYHSLAVRSNGTVVAWGNNFSGQCTVPAGLGGVVAVRGGPAYSLALKTNGTIVAWGDPSGTPVGGLTNVVDLGGGNFFEVAILGSPANPAILQSPADSTNAIGSTVTLAVKVLSPLPVSYQWRFRGNVLPGATNSTLVLTNLTPDSEGVYSVEAANSAGACGSRPAYISIIPANFLPFPVGVPGRIIAWGRNIYGETRVPPGLTNAVAISSGSCSLDTAAYTADGRVVGWGGGVKLPSAWTNKVSVASGANYTLGLNANGTVEISASPDNGALTPGLKQIRAITAGGPRFGLTVDGVVVDLGGWQSLLSGTTNAVAIASGQGHVIALLADRTVAFAKYNYPYSDATFPPAALSNIVAIASGVEHCLALRSDGIVVAWGKNDLGQCSVPAGLSNVTAIAAAGNHSMALKGDQTVVTWGDSANGLNVIPAGLTNVVGIACGWVHTAVIQAGLVFTVAPTNVIGTFGSRVQLRAMAEAVSPVSYQWALNGVDIPNATNAEFIIIGAREADAGDYAVRASADGFAVNASARLSFGFPPVVNRSPEDLWVFPGVSRSLSLEASGETTLRYQWFHDDRLLQGQTNSTLLLTNIQLADAGDYRVRISTLWAMETNVSAAVHVLNPQRMGKVIAWGASPAVPAWLSGVVAVAGGGAHGLALRADGTVVAWGDNSDKQTNVPTGLRDVTAIAAGSSHNLVLKRDGTIVGWGYNYNGQASPPGIVGALGITAGQAFSAALDADGSVIAWGNPWGDVLDVPTDVHDGIGIVTGTDHGLVLRRGGRVAGWGDDTYGQTSLPESFTNVVAVAAGHFNSMLLFEDGTIQVFGINIAGETNAPRGLSNVTSMAASYAHCVVAHTDGTVTCWGQDDQGQSTPPSGLTNVVQVAAGFYYTLAIQETGCYLYQQPQSLTALAGTNATLRVGAVGVSGLGYQWNFNGTSIPGATNDSLILPTVGFTNAGNYTVVVSSSVGTEESAPALLTVISSPIFTLQPQSDSAPLGGTVSFSVGVTGTPPVALRWYRDALSLPGKTNTTLTLTNLGLSDAGNYRVIASNALGTAVSDVAQLVVQVPARITVPPVETAGVVGSNVVFVVSAAGTEPLNYQWFKNDELLPDQTNAFLGIAEVQISDEGLYAVRVTNLFGHDSSPDVRLRVVPLDPTILQQPVSQVLRFGSNATFSVLASGSEPLKFQWSRGGVDLPGATSNTLTLSNIDASVQGDYRVLVQNGFGATSSAPAALLLQLPPNVAAWGSNQFGQILVPDDLTNAISVAGGDRHSLAIRADGTVVAWGDNSQGQCSVPDSLTNVVAIAAGGGQSLALLADGTVVGWGATNSSGEGNPPMAITNAVAIAAGPVHSLAVLADGSVVGWGYNMYGQATAPAGLTNAVAVAATFDHSVALLKDGTLYGWGNYYGEPNGLSNVVALAGANVDLLALTSGGKIASWASGNYGQLRYVGPTNAVSMDVGGANGSSSSGGVTTYYRPHFIAASKPGIVSVWGDQSTNLYAPPAGLSNVIAVSASYSHNLALVRAPFITSHPVSQKVTEGETVMFTAGVAGTGYSCQWKLNGTNIPGATTTELTFTNVTYPYAGTYQLVASNSFGWVATRTAQLEVIPFAPVIARQPQNIAAELGSIAWFDVLATGVGSLGYQWFFKEEPIAGATNSSLTISNIALNQLGVYAVLVSNAHGVTASSNALLTLPTAEVIIDNPQASVTGAWISTVASGSYGSNCLVVTQGFGAGNVRFSALLPRRGFYSVYEWHAQVNNRSVAVPCQIVTGSGTGNFSVNQGTLPGKWNLLGTYLFSADSEAAVIYADAFPDAGRVAVADAVRFVYVPAPPSIVLQPQDQIVPWGISASFSVVATGAQPLVFQWQRSGTNLTGAVATSLFWNAVHQGDAGIYSVFVTGPDGAAFSRMASLSVAAPPLSMSFGGQDLVLDWSGPAVLQTATNVLGPYLELQDLSPFTNSTATEPQRFFRLRLLPEPNHP